MDLTKIERRLLADVADRVAQRLHNSQARPDHVGIDMEEAKRDFPRRVAVLRRLQKELEERELKWRMRRQFQSLGIPEWMPSPIERGRLTNP